MTVPTWWNERRYGMFLHANVATVPSFSPIGEQAGWYRSHLGELPADETGAHASPLAEVLAYHADRWAHVERYEDFVPFLTMHRFDADELVDLALHAGMHFVVQTAKHRDGFCWWDAPGTTWTSVLGGPGRNLLAEVSAACRRRDVVFGTAYSLVDWREGDLSPIDQLERIATHQVLDLVERYGSELLWGDNDGRGELAGYRLHVAELIERAHDLADLQGIELALNDGWSSAPATFTTAHVVPPADIRLEPWALRRGLGASHSFNRAERVEHLMSSGALFDLLTEVVAKGGNLVLDVSPGVDGAVADAHQDPIREVGLWVNEHIEFVNGSRPFDLWGDAQVRYVRAGDDVLAVDLAAAAEVVFAGLTPDRYEVTSITADDGAALHWEQHRGGVTVNRVDRSPVELAGLYRITLVPAVENIRLFDEGDDVTPQAMQPLLDAVGVGGIVQLGDGPYFVAADPGAIPDGVTVRGMGWDRTWLLASAGATLAMGDDSRLEALHVRGPQVTLQVRGSGAALVGCRVDGVVEVVGHDAVLRTLIGSTVVVSGERTTIEHCSLKGALDDVGIAATGGFGHRIMDNELVDHLCSIRLTSTSASCVAGNRCAARWWGVHLVNCDHVEVFDNSVRNTMRAVDVGGGNGSVVRANWVADGDSGALIELGATDTSVLDNHIERCRIGVLVWDAPTTRIASNTFVDIHEEEPCVVGPDSDH